MVSTKLQSNLGIHPDFNDPDGDLIIEAEGGIRFRTHRILLRLSSPLFRDILSRQERLDGVLHIHENPFLVANLLRMISFQPIPAFETLDGIEELLSLAEKYQMAGPISILRGGMAFIPNDDADILQVYRIACRLGWRAEAQVASMKTLSLDLGDVKHAPSLALLETSDLLSLQQLHRARRDGLAQLLADESRFPSIFAFQCVQHPASVSHEARAELWATVSAYILQRFSLRPNGEYVKNLTPRNNPILRTLRFARCSFPTCPNHNRTDFFSEIVETISRAIEELPNVIGIDTFQRRDANKPTCACSDHTTQVELRSESVVIHPSPVLVQPLPPTPPSLEMAPLFSSSSSTALSNTTPSTVTIEDTSTVRADQTQDHRAEDGDLTETVIVETVPATFVAPELSEEAAPAVPPQTPSSPVPRPVRASQVGKATSLRQLEQRIKKARSKVKSSAQEARDQVAALARLEAQLSTPMSAAAARGLQERIEKRREKAARFAQVAEQRRNELAVLETQAQEAR